MSALCRKWATDRLGWKRPLKPLDPAEMARIIAWKRKRANLSPEEAQLEDIVKHICTLRRQKDEISEDYATSSLRDAA